MNPLTVFLRLQNCSAKSVKVQQSYRSVVESRVHTLSRQQLCTTALITCPEGWVERHCPVILWLETHQGFPVSSSGGRRTSLSLKVNYYLIHLIKDKNVSPYQKNHDNGLFGAFSGGVCGGGILVNMFHSDPGLEGPRKVWYSWLLAEKANFTVATDKNTRNSKKQKDTLPI